MNETAGIMHGFSPATEDLFFGPAGTPSLGPGFRWEDTQRRVRVVFGGETIADSTRVMRLQEAGRLPVYYFPMDDVRLDLLHATNETSYSPLKGHATYWTVRAGGRAAENVAWSYSAHVPGGPPVQGYIAFYWHAMDRWFEEDEEVFGNARDPYKRIDVIASSRHVQVILNGELLGDTRRPMLVLETGMAQRFYLPAEDVRMDLLCPTDLKTYCPYKGEASYWCAMVPDGECKTVAWSYVTPLPECTHIAGHLCFYSDQVDAVVVDGTVMQPAAAE